MNNIEKKSLQEKTIHLRNILQEFSNGVVIGYSGGVDSSLIAKVATEELGNKALVVIADSPSLARSELKEALMIAKNHDFNLRIIKTNEIKNQDYVKNNSNRCYFCKLELYSKLTEIKKKENYDTIIDGANMDDLQDFRPGKKAAQKEGVRSILQEAHFTKKDIRELAKNLKLENYNKWASPCLASRIPYGISVESSVLEKVEKAENFLKSNYQIMPLRVRYYNSLAKIETNNKGIEIILKNRQIINNFFKSIGFKFTSIDIIGFQSGSLNQDLFS